MEQFSAARRILETFREGKTFICLRELAKASGFPRVSNRDFKSGFNYLVRQGVLKLQQSGWRSEKRGGKSHLKTVILTADVYEIIDSDFVIDPEKISNLDKRVSAGVQQTLRKHATLSEHRKEQYKKCENCKHNPIVYLTRERIGVCKKHWLQLANTDIEW